MPNWCANELTITGDPGTLKKFDEQFKKEHVEYDVFSACRNKKNIDKNEYKKYIDYKIIPYNNMFASQKEKDNYCTINIIAEEKLSKEYSFNNFIPIKKENILNGWRDWSINNWGTKWDICNINNNNNTSLENKYYYYFDTAWNPCTPVIEEMARQYPTLHFLYYYYEEGCCFGGKIIFKNGIVIDSEDVNGYEKLRIFLKDNNLREYDYECSKCGYPMEECEFEDKEPCPKCGCKKIIKNDI